MNLRESSQQSVSSKKPRIFDDNQGYQSQHPTNNSIRQSNHNLPSQSQRLPNSQQQFQSPNQIQLNQAVSPKQYYQDQSLNNSSERKPAFAQQPYRSQVNNASFQTSQHQPPQQQFQSMHLNNNNKPQQVNYIKDSDGHTQVQLQHQSPQRQSHKGHINKTTSPYALNKQSENCPEHPTYVVTNICVNQQCMEPLCPKCIKKHISLHKENGGVCQIEHIDDKRIEAIEEIANDVYNLEKERDLIGHFNEAGKQELIQLCHNRLQESKLKVMNRVDMFFQNFEAELSTKIAQHKFRSPGDQNNLNGRLDQFIQQLYNMEKTLEGNRYIMDLIRVLSGEFGTQYMNIHEEVDESIENYVEGLVNLGIDESKLNVIDEALNQYVLIEPYYFDHENISDKRAHRGQNQQYKSKNKFYQQQNNGDMQNLLFDQQQRSGKPSANKSYHTDISQNNQLVQMETPQKNLMTSTDNLSDVEIDMPNYFSENCSYSFLHFFQDNSKLIKYVNLKGISKDPNSKQFEISELEINFKVPMYSRSVIGPEGDIYLTGGLSIENKSQPTSAAYIVDYKKNTLKYLPNMICERSSHGICFMNGFIYVVGGEDRNETLKRCEKYDINHNKWIEIAPLNYPSSNCSITGFRNKDIFKFGGKLDAFTQSMAIEKYDSYNDIWNIVGIQSQYEGLLQIPNNTACAQINNSEIIILGGSLEHENLNQAIVYRENDEQENKGIVYPVKSLPREGTFWQNAIVQSNVIFCLQNIPIEQKQDHCYLGKKHFLAFQGKQWKELQ